MKQCYTVEYIHKFCRPLFSHEYAINKLKANGYKIGLASNSIRKTIMLMMEKANLIDYFDTILSNEDVANAKPNPEIYIKTMELMGFSPKECLILEDNENGIKAAIDSGAHLMKINSISDVNYKNIIEKIRNIETK